MNTPSIPEAGNTSNPLSDLGVARTYLAELAKMCARAPKSQDPREIWLAVGVAKNRCVERIRRCTEVYSFECGSCGNAIEIPTEPPHSCPKCGRALAIEWGTQ